jgi:hypothetical protein
MLSKLQVAQLARDCGLSQWTHDLVSTVSVRWELSAIDVATLAPGASKVGGLPDLAPDEAWPMNGRGIPMTLMAQLDLSQLPPPGQDWTLDDASWSAPSGLMRIFADVADSPSSMCRAAMLLCPVAVPLRAAALPPVPDPWPAGSPNEWFYREERQQILPEIAVEFSPFLSAPELHPETSAVWDTGPEAAQGYQRWLDQLRLGERGDEVTFALAGHPLSIQNDIRGATSLCFEEFFAADPDEDLSRDDAWRPLLTLFGEDAYGVHISDIGAFYVLAPTQDLLHNRYDRLICVPEAA